MLAFLEGIQEIKDSIEFVHICEDTNDGYEIYLKGYESYKQRKQRLAFNLFSVSAKQGDSHGQGMLGYCHETGFGIEQSFENAFFWYSRSAEQNNPTALFNLGTVYKEGRGVPKDLVKAKECFKKSADLGDKDALDKYNELNAISDETKTIVFKFKEGGNIIPIETLQPDIIFSDGNKIHLTNESFKFKSDEIINAQKIISGNKKYSIRKEYSNLDLKRIEDGSACIIQVESCTQIEICFYDSGNYRPSNIKIVFRRNNGQSYAYTNNFVGELNIWLPGKKEEYFFETHSRDYIDIRRQLTSSSDHIVLKLERDLSKHLYRYEAVSNVGSKAKNDTCFLHYSSENFSFFILCDGMHNNGDIASHTAVSEISTYMEKHRGNIDDSNIAKEIINAVKSANEKIYDKAHKEKDCELETTIAFVVITRKAVYLTHVGNSRIYQLRGGKKIYKSKDNSVYYEMMAKGTITEEQAEELAKRSDEPQVTKTLGRNKTIDFHVSELTYKENDKFVLCCDGIWKSIKESDLIKMVCKEDASKAVESVINKVTQTVYSNQFSQTEFSLIVTDMKRDSFKQQGLFSKIRRLLN